MASAGSAVPQTATWKFYPAQSIAGFKVRHTMLEAVGILVGDEVAIILEVEFLKA